MSSQRVSGTAVQRTIAVLGSAVFFVVAPFTLAGLVPWSITGWQLRPPFLGLELTRGIGAIMILAGVPGLVDALRHLVAVDSLLETIEEGGVEEYLATQFTCP